MRALTTRPRCLSVAQELPNRAITRTGVASWPHTPPHPRPGPTLSWPFVLLPLNLCQTLISPLARSSDVGMWWPSVTAVWPSCPPVLYKPWPVYRILTSHASSTSPPTNARVIQLSSGQHSPMLHMYDHYNSAISETPYYITARKSVYRIWEGQIAYIPSGPHWERWWRSAWTLETGSGWEGTSTRTAGRLADRRLPRGLYGQCGTAVTQSCSYHLQTERHKATALITTIGITGTEMIDRSSLVWMSIDCRKCVDRWSMTVTISTSCLIWFGVKIVFRMDN